MPPFWGRIQTVNLLISPHTTLITLINLEMNTQLTLLDSHSCFPQPGASYHELQFHGFKSCFRNAAQNWFLLELVLCLRPLLCSARIENHLKELPHPPRWLFALVNQPPGWLFLLLSFLICLKLIQQRKYLVSSTWVQNRLSWCGKSDEMRMEKKRTRRGWGSKSSCWSATACGCVLDYSGHTAKPPPPGMKALVKKGAGRDMFF